MRTEICKGYSIAKGDSLEYRKCLEILEELGYKKIEVEDNILNCRNCILSSRCDVLKAHPQLAAAC